MGSPLYYASRANMPLDENDGEKELIIQDLCARSPYDVKINLEYEGQELIGTLEAVYPNDECIIVEKLNHEIKANDYFTVDYGRFSIEETHFKPYLRPMLSMTEEEKKEYLSHCTFYNFHGVSRYFDNYKSIDWLNKHHFDYRGLISKGLALEAPEGMYNLEKK